MKKIYFAAGLLPLLTMAVSSCDGNYDDRYPEAYHNVIKFQVSNQQPIDLYSTETTQVYNFTIQRGGSAQKESAVNVQVSTMTVEEFKAYTEDYGFTYLSQVPVDAYKFSNNTNANDIVFAAGQTYHLDSLLVDVDKVYAFMQSLPNTQTPVIPIQLKSENASINDEGQYLFLVPSYNEPQIGLGLRGLRATTLLPSEAKAGKIKVTVPVQLPIINRWPLKFDLEVSQELLDQVNAAEGTTYAMMDPSLYTGIVSPNQEFTFNLGANTTNIDIEIDAPNLPFSKVALPIKLASISGLDIDINPSANYVVLGYNVSLISSYSTNDPEPTEGPLDGLFDNNPGTFFHSAWSTGATADSHHPTYGSYIEFTFAAPLQCVSFDFQCRSNNNNGAPKTVHLYVSNDRENWAKMAEVTDMLTVLSGGGAKGHFGNFQHTEPFKYLRFCVIESKAGSLTTANSAYWNGAELQINSEEME
ncbi:MAG: DUF1735 domain-containing protein [Paramuribaculum sp.]|nr:DUF1735 domain-containing protein [Paramuribaculum sp.]